MIQRKNEPYWLIRESNHLLICFLYRMFQMNQYRSMGPTDLQVLAFEYGEPSLPCRLRRNNTIFFHYVGLYDCISCFKQMNIQLNLTSKMIHLDEAIRIEIFATAAATVGGIGRNSPGIYPGPQRWLFGFQLAQYFPRLGSYCRYFVFREWFAAHDVYCRS